MRTIAPICAESVARSRLMREQPVVQANADARRVARVVAVRVDLVRIARQVAREAVVVDAGQPLGRRQVLDAVFGDRALSRRRLGPSDAAVEVVLRTVLAIQLVRKVGAVNHTVANTAVVTLVAHLSHATFKEEFQFE